MELSKKHLTAAITAGIGLALFQKLSSSEPPSHDELLEQTHKAVTAATDATVSVVADHGVGDSDTDGDLAVDGIEGRPDLVARAFDSANLIVEVETAQALADRTDHVAEQLDGFRKEGYRRVLVVPDMVTSAAETLVEDLEGEVTVSTPEQVAELL